MIPPSIFHRLALVLLGVALSACGGDPSPKPASPQTGAETGNQSSERAASSSPDEFTFLHLSDTHIGPFEAEPVDYSRERSYDALQKIAREGATHNPAFILHTGDLTEYGLGHATQAAATGRFLNALPAAMVVVPGNHDNTWATDHPFFQQQNGGMNFHFRHRKVHFIGLNTATPQDPIQSVGREVLEFLHATLKTIEPSEPIIVFFHHPPSDRAWASDYEPGRIADLLRPHHVLAVLVGHHHAVKAEKFQGLDVIHGGSTFDKTTTASEGGESVAGFSVARVEGDLLTITYQHLDGRRKELLRKPIAPPKKLLVNRFGAQVLEGRILFSGVASDGFDTGSVTLAGAEHRISVGGESFRVEVLDAILDPGLHHARVDLYKDGTWASARYTEFIQPGDARALWRTQLDGAVRGLPAVDGDDLFATTASGSLWALDRQTGQVRWSYRADQPIDYFSLVKGTGPRPDRTEPSPLLAGPTATEDSVLIAGADGYVREIDRDRGTLLRQTPRAINSRPLYTAPLVFEQHVVVCGMDGHVVSFTRDLQRVRWRNTEANFSVEATLLLHEGSLFYTAWDGYLHACSLEDGRSLARSASASGLERFSRYHAPGDFTPQLLNGRLYFADRGYQAASYSLDGALQIPLGKGIAAVSVAEGEDALLLRPVDGPVRKVTTDGTLLWESTVHGNRKPTPLVSDGRFVYLDSYDGRITRLNQATGEELESYQYSPGLSTPSGLIVDEGIVYTAGQDGRVSAIRFD